MLIQRYSVSMWPQVRGDVPFIVRGPNWSGRHVMRKALETSNLSDLAPDEIRLVVAEWMLKEEFCQAAWPIELETCAPIEERWKRAIRQCADEIPKVCDEWPIHIGAWELLDGMSRLEHYRNLLSYDSVVLESMEIPSGS